MDPIPLAQLEHKDHGDSIRCVEGVVISIFQEKNDPYGKWVIQNATIEDSSGKHSVMFNHRSTIQPTEIQGKCIRINAGTKGTKFRGLSLDISEYQGTPIRKIKVSDGARVEVLENSQPQSKPVVQQKPVNNYNNKAVISNGSTVSTRVDLYFQVLEEVNERFSKGCKVPLSPSDLNDIATSISLSYRGDKGSYLEPVFSLENESLPASKNDTSQSTNQSVDWEEYIVDGKPLSAHPPELVKGWIRSAFFNPPTYSELNSKLYDASRAIRYTPEQAFKDEIAEMEIDYSVDAGAWNDFWKGNFGINFKYLKQTDYLRAMQFAGDRIKLTNLLQKAIDDEIPF